MAELSTEEWKQYIARHPEAHILQSAEWGELKAGFGWSVIRLASSDCGAQILFRRLPLGFSMAYLPKGPVGASGKWNELWREVDAHCRKHRAIMLIVEPDIWSRNGQGKDATLPPGFQPGLRSIQPPRTIVVDLTADETQILNRMKQKTRYNIRLAAKKGVRIQTSSDVSLFHQLLIETGQRDQFGIHSQKYYRVAYDLFHESGNCEIFLAEVNGEIVAGLMVFLFGRRAWYFYGASRQKFREFMPSYLLQWEAMRWAKSRGCQEYDLWGVPDFNEQVLEAEFKHRSDGLWGVYRFKRGFGGELRRAIGPWERVYHPLLHTFYRWWIGSRDMV